MGKGGGENGMLGIESQGSEHTLAEGCQVAGPLFFFEVEAQNPDHHSRGRGGIIYLVSGRVGQQRRESLEVGRFGLGLQFKGNQAAVEAGEVGDSEVSGREENVAEGPHFKVIEARLLVLVGYVAGAYIAASVGPRRTGILEAGDNFLGFLFKLG